MYPNTFDKMFFQKSSTTSKRGVGLLQNSLITERYYNALNDDDIHRNVKTDVNFCKRVALVEKIVNAQIPFMTLDSLSQIIDLIYTRLTAGKMTIETDKFVPKAALDADMIHLFIQLKTAHRSRCMTKTIELLPPDCTCHLKCRGPIYGRKVLNKLVDQLYQTSHASKICGLCRLAMSVENTTSAKPKEYMNPENPALSACSFDGCTTSFNSPSHFFYPVKNDQNQDHVYEIGHRAFITNSLTITDSVYKKSVSTATGRVSTMCISGSRTCTRGVIKMIRSARQVKFDPDFYNLHKWWRCSVCVTVKPYCPDAHEFFTEDIHKMSCIGLFFANIKSHPTSEDIARLAATMCLPCRMACMCRHAQSGLYTKRKLILQSNMRSSAPANVRKHIPKHQAERGIGEILRQISLLTKLQRYIINNTSEWKSLGTS